MTTADEIRRLDKLPNQANPVDVGVSTVCRWGISYPDRTLFPRLRMAVLSVPIQTRKLDDLTAWVRHPDKGLEGPMPILDALARMMALQKEHRDRDWKPLVIIDPKDAEEFGR